MNLCGFNTRLVSGAIISGDARFLRGDGEPPIDEEDDEDEEAADSGRVGSLKGGDDGMSRTLAAFNLRGDPIGLLT